jgi:hypothetical protein
MSQPQPTLLEVLQKDVLFLKQYLAFPNRVRQTAAEHWLRVLRESPNDVERKTAVIKIFEELLASEASSSMLSASTSGLEKVNGRSPTLKMRSRNWRRSSPASGSGCRGCDDHRQWSRSGRADRSVAGCLSC